MQKNLLTKITEPIQASKESEEKNKGEEGDKETQDQQGPDYRKD